MPGQRLLPPLHFFVYLVLTLMLHLVIPIKQLFGWPYRWIGAPFILFGTLLIIWAERLFKRYETAEVPFRESKKLVTEGPFRVSRHPMYLGMAMILLGLAIMLGSLAGFLAPAAFIATVEIIFIYREEKMMLESFGDEYEKYRRRVRRWL